jgi:hypothetical protein
MNGTQPLTITITIDQEGGMQVLGPINDKVLCLGMLEMAKQIVIMHKAENNLVVPKLVIPRGVPS